MAASRVIILRGGVEFSSLASARIENSASVFLDRSVEL